MSDSRRRSSKRRIWKPSQITSWALRATVVVLVSLSPWFYGSANYGTQGYLYLAGLAIAVLLSIHCVVCAVTHQAGWGPNWLAWLLFCLGGFALLQAQARYDWNSGGSPSVVMQRWALGLAPAPDSLRKDLVEIGPPVETLPIPCDLQAVPEEQRRLAISMEPSATRGAAGCLFLSAIVVWIGSAVFRQRSSHIYLLVAMTGLSVAVAIFGIHSAVSYRDVNALGLSTGTGSSFACFVSKNSAGAFLNMGIAAALGLVSWTMIHVARQKSDMRYRFADGSLLARVRGGIEDLLSDLNSVQIGALFCLIVLISALLISMCRGAAVSALAAFVTGVLMVIPGKKSGAAIALSMAAIGLCILAIVGLQLDERVLSRLESLGEIDFETESRTGRTYIWGVSIHAAAFYGWLGSGLGTFHYSSLPFQRPSNTGWYYHAESIFAEAAVDLGYIGLLAVVIGLGWALRGVQSIQSKDNFRMFVPMRLAGVYLLVSQAVHSLVDFSLILPGVHLPCGLLLGAVLGCSPESRRVLTKIREMKRKVTQPMAAALPSNAAHPRGIVMLSSLSMLVGSSLGLYYSYGIIPSLAAAQSIRSYFDADNKKPILERNPERVDALVERCIEQNAPLTLGPELMRLLGDAIVFEYRHQQLLRRPATSEPKAYWNQTAPLLVRLALKNNPDEPKRLEIVRVVGGESRLANLNRASFWYARAHALSPLDWRCVWGRLISNTQCPTNAFNCLLPVVQRTSGHLPQTLISASILFDEDLRSEQSEALWKMAMRSDPSAASNVANFLSTKRPEAEISVDLFPQNPFILQALATTVFKKSQYPDMHRRLWLATKELIPSSRMSAPRKAIWLADAFRELDDSDGEIEQLKVAIKFQPNDAPLLVRLANVLEQTDDAKGFSATIQQLMRIDPNNSSLRQLIEKDATKRMTVPKDE